MPLPVYPGPDLLPGMTYASKWTPQFFNREVSTAAGAQINLAVARYPLHDFELTYSFLRDGPGWHAAMAGLEFKTMMGFFLQMAGTVGRYLYRNPADSQVFRNKIGTGDGAATDFLLTRTFGANGYSGTEPIGQVDAVTLFNVYLGTSTTPVDPADYDVSTAVPGANVLSFDTAPADGTDISVDMAYFYYCKLGSDQNTFEKFMSNIWSLNQITLHSCRAGA